MSTNNQTTKRRPLGLFQISKNLQSLHPDAVASMLSEVAVMQVTETEDGLTEYVGLCEAFTPIREGDNLPRYIGIFKCTNQGCNFDQWLPADQGGRWGPYTDPLCVGVEDYLYE